jgi:hypothetical protein
MTGLLVAAALLSALVFLALQREWRGLARPRHRRVASVTLLADMRAYNEALRQVGISVVELERRWRALRAPDAWVASGVAIADQDPGLWGDQA